MLEEQEKAQFTTFKNTKETEVIGLQQRLFEKKEQLLKQQEQLIREIKEQEEEKVNSAHGKIDRKKLSQEKFDPKKPSWKEPGQEKLGQKKSGS